MCFQTLCGWFSEAILSEILHPRYTGGKQSYPFYRQVENIRAGGTHSIFASSLPMFAEFSSSSNIDFYVELFNLQNNDLGIFNAINIFMESL